MTYSSSTFQFTHLLQRVYDKLEQVKGITATGGTTATIIDTALSADYQDFSDFDGATCFVQRDYAGAGAAPEGEFALVTGYAASTYTLSFSASSFSVAVGAGDEILIAQGGIYPLRDVKRKCVTALRNLGDVVNVDTSLSTADSQTEYDVPSGIPYRSIVDVKYQYNTGDSDDNRYKSIPFEIVPDTSIGGADAVIKIAQMDDSRTLQVWSVGPHTDLYNYYDPISVDIHPTLAVAACALECASINRQAAEQQGLLEKLLAERREAEIMHPIKKYIKKIHGMPHWSGERRYAGDQSIYDR